MHVPCTKCVILKHKAADFQLAVNTFQTRTGIYILKILINLSGGLKSSFPYKKPRAFVHIGNLHPEQWNTSHITKWCSSSAKLYRKALVTEAKFVKAENGQRDCKTPQFAKHSSRYALLDEVLVLIVLHCLAVCGTNSPARF